MADAQPSPALSPAAAAAASGSRADPTDSVGAALIAAGLDRTAIDAWVAQRAQAHVTQALAAAAAARPPVAPAVSAAAQLPRPPLPAKFTGKQASDVDRFLSEMTKLMDYHCMANEAQRVRYAAQFLTDDADVWWASLHQPPVQANAQGLAAPAGLAPAATITTWADMKQRIIERFRPQLAATEARAALDRLRQTTSVREYNARFTALTEQVPDMAEGEKLWRYLAGLKEEIKLSLHIRAADQPTDVITAQRLALLIDATAFRTREQRGAFATLHGGYPRQFTRPSPMSGLRPAYHAPSNQGAAPMELAAMDGEAPEEKYDQPELLAAMPTRPLPKLTDTERERLRRLGLCFRCRVGAHLSRECPMTAGYSEAPRKNVGGGQQ